MTDTYVARTTPDRVLGRTYAMWSIISRAGAALAYILVLIASDMNPATLATWTAMALTLVVPPTHTHPAPHSPGAQSRQGAPRRTMPIDLPVFFSQRRRRPDVHAWLALRTRQGNLHPPMMPHCGQTNPGTAETAAERGVGNGAVTSPNAGFSAASMIGLSSRLKPARA